MSKMRARRVEKAIKLAYESLESHLEYAYMHSLSRKPDEIEQDYIFHKKCVKEYAQIILHLSNLY